ncbi:MAG: hypothetical protein AUJ20_01805 [Comamonadaceae bacterium CG1_02_60_18]|nr:MAG: hypothetical protein AUJ20_01805 [Comamonadaceae bacterium CG1_02_60_18]PIQ55591.1 MAG: hypothetical protein COW02_03145 [Comamonadaceae bacterium CG12_big_fil_rev_8_21_14_0_65_59_15]
MEPLIVVLVALVGLRLLAMREQRARIALLGEHLAHHQIEQLMESVVQGSLRALGESESERQASIWSMLQATQTELAEQVGALALAFSKVAEPDARISKLPLALPFATRWWPAICVDARKLISLHAHALRDAAQGAPDASPKSRAFTFMAELFLFQHTCHWFCRSQVVASARLLARHQTAYTQVLASVAAPTRQAYRALMA